jgi:HAD superfamily hydrolase (TIGR01509 family)
VIRAVIFDMGHTLLRYVRRGGGSWRELESPGIRQIYQYLVEQGHPIEAAEDAFVDAMFGRLAEGWEQATGGHINLRALDWISSAAADHAVTLDELALAEAIRRYAMPVREGLAASPGAIETLATLRERGYRIGLISNTIWPAELHIEDLQQVGVLPYLEQMVYSGEFGVWKPNPPIFQHVAELLGVAPEQVVFVGDSPREDIVGAQRAGMRAVWVRNESFPLGEVRPDAVIEALPELLPIVEGWCA